ncbi:hypothetical protein P369_17615 [Comamonas thiooxydans]|nr:hypothetical protein P369_17615 [Comamonas thiooxydans]
MRDAMRIKRDAMRMKSDAMRKEARRYADVLSNLSTQAEFCSPAF